MTIIEQSENPLHGHQTDLSSAQTHDQKTALAGHIARALAVFCVDEIVVFSDTGYPEPPPPASSAASYTGFIAPTHFLAHLLSYLETPPHLRKVLFPLHPNLRTAGMLPSLDMPHHLRAHEWCLYREGVVLDTMPEATATATATTTTAAITIAKGSTGSFVDAGFAQPVRIASTIPPSTRVTLKFPSATPPPSFTATPPAAQAVAPDEARSSGGYYWGYSVRTASSLSTVLTEAPFPGGYDVTIGTSERGTSIAKLVGVGQESAMPAFKHALVVFGGVAGLEAAAKADGELAGVLGEAGVAGLFDFWVNLVEGQGSRTVRTEEAVWIGMAALRGVLLQRGIR